MDEVEEWDSLAHVMLIGMLEERFGISIPLDEAVEITSVKEILEYAGE
jgi:acyl carrier protein